MGEPLTLLILFISGIIMSFINMMAGGGGVITVGALLLLGVEPSVANGTYRIAVLTATGSGTLAFRHEKVIDTKQSLFLSLATLPGAIAGAFLSLNISAEYLRFILALVMLLVIVSLFIPKRKKDKNDTSKTTNLKKHALYPVMFFIGFYGGFIQIGIGFILMIAFNNLLTSDLVKVNMHKVFVVLIFTIPVALIFALNDKVNWLYALAICAGTIIGSWLSVKLAVKKGNKIVKYVLAFSTIMLAVKLIFFW